MFTLNSHWNCICIQFRIVSFYTSIMDTTYYSNIPVETLSLLDCDVRNFDFNHPIKNIFFDNIDYIRKLDASGKARPCILDNVERSLLYHTCYLGFDQFECTNCDNWYIIPHSCHSRFCNACGVKYAKQLAAKATTVLIDTLSLLFPKNLETGSDRLVLDSIYCLLLLETPFPFLPINLLLINSKRKSYLIPTIYSKTFLFIMSLVCLPLYILLERTLNGIHTFIVLFLN